MTRIEGVRTSPGNDPIVDQRKITITSLSASIVRERGKDSIDVGRKSQSSKAVVVTGR